MSAPCNRTLAEHEATVRHYAHLLAYAASDLTRVVLEARVAGATPAQVAQWIYETRPVA